MEAQPFLIFRLNGSLYGIAAQYVEEIFFLPELTPISEVPPDIAGVLNWRGEIVPIIDLLSRLGHRDRTYDLNDSIVMLKKQNEVSVAGLRQRMGIIVNQACDVVAIAPSNISTPFSQAGSSSSHLSYCVEGIAQINADIIMLLNPEQLLNYTESIALPLDKSERTLVYPSNVEMSDRSREISSRFREFTPQQLEVLRQRADNLRHQIDSQDFTGLTPIAAIGLNGEYFGLELGIICEFTEIKQVAPIPCCPPHIVGNINLRGEILTLIDISRILNLKPVDLNKVNKAMVIEIDDIIAGIIVDEVCDVMYLLPAQIKPVPAAVQSQDEEYLRGMVVYRDKMMSLLDLSKVLLQGRLTVDEEF